MNREQLIEIIAAKTGETKATTERVLITLIQTVQDTVAAGEPVVLQRFGTFSMVNAPARTIADIQTGEKRTLPARRRVKFKTGSRFAEAVDNA
ncbi:MAG: HU family DNA-binding protein [Rhodanobacter sp.]